MRPAGRRGCVWPGLSRPLLLDVRLGLGVAPQGRRQVPRLVEILWRILEGFCESLATPHQCWVFRIQEGNVTPGVGERYAGGWGTLRRGLARVAGNVTTGVGCCYYGAFGLLISHLPLAYSVTVQPTAVSSISALRAVWRRFFMASGLA